MLITLNTATFPIVLWALCDENDSISLIDKEYVLQKNSGKGGWTYVEIPEIDQNSISSFGWVTVSGFIDDYELVQYKLMPMGNGKFFLPVKAAIRKRIKIRSRRFGTY